MTVATPRRPSAPADVPRNPPGRPGGGPREVAIANHHPELRFRAAELTRLIAVLDAWPSAARPPPQVPPGELSLVFLTDQALARLHADFLDDPTPTDVITFAGDPTAGTAGEICVSVDTAARVARKRNEDFAAELSLYVVHGWLHLAGHDDRLPAERRLMRAAERRALQRLRRHQAIPHFRIR